MNKNNSIIQSLFEVNGKLEKVLSSVNAAKNALVASDVRKYEEMLTKSIFSLENSILRMREIANYSLKLNNYAPAIQRISDKVSDEAYHIELEKNEKYFRIKMPETMPHYSTNPKSILAAPLNNSLRNYHKKNHISKYEKAVIVFVNHVNRDASIKTVRDNDNYDYKQIINTVAYWFLPDDSFKCCNMFTTTKLDDSAYSEIFIIPAENFNEFYQKNIANIL